MVQFCDTIYNYLTVLSNIMYITIISFYTEIKKNNISSYLDEYINIESYKNYVDNYMNYNTFIIESVKSCYEGVYSSVKNYIDTQASNDVNFMFESVKSGSMDVYSPVKNYIDTQAPNDVNFMFESIKSGSMDVYSSVKNYIDTQAPNDVNFMFESIKSGYDDVYSSVKNYIDTQASNDVNFMFESVKSSYDDVYSSVKNYIDTQASNDVNFMIESIKSGSMDVYSSVKNYIDTQVSNDVNFMIESIKSGSMDVYSSVKNYIDTQNLLDKTYSMIGTYNLNYISNKYKSIFVNADFISDELLINYNDKIIPNSTIFTSISLPTNSNIYDQAYIYETNLTESVLTTTKNLLDSDINYNTTQKYINTNDMIMNSTVINNFKVSSIQEENNYFSFLYFILFVFIFYFNSKNKVTIKKEILNKKENINIVKEIKNKIDNKIKHKLNVSNKEPSTKSAKNKILKMPKTVTESKLKIKKPRTVYNFFCLEERPKLKKEFVGYHSKEINAYLSLKWGMLKDSFNEEDKRQLLKYKNMVLQDIERYKKEINC